MNSILIMPKQTGLKSTEIKQRTQYHGNRKLQRFRKQRQTDQTNNSLLEILMHAAIQLFHPNDEESDEESSKESNEEEEEEAKQQIDHKTCLNQHQSIRENHKRRMSPAYLSIDKWKLSKDLIPNYSKFPNHMFKHLLCKAIPRYCHQINQYLADPKLLSFIQQDAHLMCTIFQLEMEKDYWKHAINGLLSAINWLSPTSKNLTQRYSINWDYPRTEHNIRHRQQLTENKLEQVKRKLQLHLQQYSSCWSIPHKTSRHQIMTIISEVLIVVIQNGLQKLHTRFEEQKILMQFDVYDVYLLKSLYDLNPTEEQKLTVEKIWRSKRKSCQRIIHQIKTNLFDKKQVTTQDDTSSMFEENSRRLYIDYAYQQDQVTFLESLNPVMRTIIETRQTNIERRTQQIIAFKNTSSTQ